MRDPRENESGHDQRLPMPVNAPLPVPPAEVVSDGKAKDKTYAGRTAWEKSEELNKDLLRGITGHIFGDEEMTQLGHGGGGDAIGKGGGGDAIGEGGEDSCGCPPIKNYPAFTGAPSRTKKESGRRKYKGYPKPKEPTCVGFPKGFRKR